MNITIRPEQPGDYREVEVLTRDAFWDVYAPGCDEHLLVHKIRHISAFVKELDFVAVTDNRIIGNIIFTRAEVVDDSNIVHEVLTMGPVSVLPAYQRQGVGSALIKHSIVEARKTGFGAILIFGSPDYYNRFGFVNAGKYNIRTSSGDNSDAFMALELYENSLSGITGKFYIDPVFQVDKNELEEFEKGFPYREKHVTDTQLK